MTHFDGGARLIVNLVSVVQKEPVLCAGWERLRTKLSPTVLWESIKTNWLRDLVRAALPDGTFQTGGDRKSAQFRNAKQRAIVEFVETTARAADPDLDDDAVVAQCIDSVGQRWRASATGGGVAILHRVVRRVARRVRSGGDDDDVGGPLVDRAFDDLAIEEVTSTAVMGPSKLHHMLMQHVLQTPSTNGNAALLSDLMRLASEELLLARAEEERKTKEAEVHHTELQVALAREERPLRQQEADNATRRLELDQVTERRPPSRTTKPTTDDDAACLLREARRKWHNMQCLSVAIWDHHRKTLPPDVAPDPLLRDVFANVVTRAPALLQKYKLRLLGASEPYVTAVYCAADTDMPAVTARFWAKDDGTPMAASSRGGRRTTVAAPPPPGVSDLLEAVVGAGLDDVARKSALQRLNTHFRRPMAAEWAVLWPRMTPAVATKALWTHIDVERDPIVPQLRQWIATTDRDACPAYPAVGTVDLRPVEPIPSALRCLDVDAVVWPCVRRAGLERAFAKHYGSFQQSAGAYVPAAGTPSDERLRQFRRLTSTATALTYKAIGECLGWFTTNAAGPRDTLLARQLVQAFLQCAALRGDAGPITDVTRWYDNGQWTWELCLWEMRVATVLISRLRTSGTDLRFLAQDVATSMPPVKAAA